MTIDAQTISALAATAAAVAAGTVAGIQFYVGYRQSKAALISAQAAMMSAKSAGLHTIAEFRQEWIYKLTDTICDLNAILVTRWDREDVEKTSKDRMTYVSLQTRLELLLNVKEPDAIALIEAVRDVLQSRDDLDKIHRQAVVTEIANRVLKTEWTRLKAELYPTTTTLDASPIPATPIHHLLMALSA
ncbi:MAG: hypothetical protein WCA81_15095 [Rhizomicrobium sp.]